MTPKYLEKMKDAVSRGLLAVNGNRLLIELLEEGEKVTKSGIVVEVKTPKHMAASDRARVAVVLAVGAGYETEDGEKVEVAYAPGDYIVVNQFGVKTFGEFFGLSEYKPDTLGLITEDLIHAKLSNFEEFEAILKR
jgi:co-chaperonin GroES (HSP10)